MPQVERALSGSRFLVNNETMHCSVGLALIVDLRVRTRELVETVTGQ